MWIRSTYSRRTVKANTEFMSRTVCFAILTCIAISACGYSSAVEQTVASTKTSPESVPSDNLTSEIPEAFRLALTPDEAFASLAVIMKEEHRIGGPELASALDNASEFETSLLSDGILTFSEYEQAFLARVSCLQEEGFRVPYVHITAIGRFDSPVLASGDDAYRRASEVFEACRVYFDQIPTLWNDVISELFAGVVNGSREWVAQCVTERGYGPEDEPWRTSADGPAQAYADCIREMQQAYGLNTISFGMTGDGS